MTEQERDDAREYVLNWMQDSDERWTASMSDADIERFADEYISGWEDLRNAGNIDPDDYPPLPRWALIEHMEQWRAEAQADAEAEAPDPEWDAAWKRLMKTIMEERKKREDQGQG